MQQDHFKKNIYHCYKEFVEFLNQLQLHPHIVQLLIALQILSPILALLPLSSPGEPYSSFSIALASNVLQASSKTHSFLSPIFLSMILSLCLSPLLGVAHIIYSAYFKLAVKNTEYKKMCNLSLFNRFVRVYMITFEYICLPIFLFYAAGSQSFSVSLVVILLCLGTVIVTDYHLLQIRREGTDDGSHLLKVHFPNKLFDTAALFGIALLVNVSTGVWPFLVVVLGCSLRLLLFGYLSHYPPQLKKWSGFYLSLSLVFSTGLLLAYCTSSFSIALLILVTMTILFFFAKPNIINFITTADKSTHLSQEEEESLGEEPSTAQKLWRIQQNLWGQGRFAGAFCQLIFAAKRDQTYREFLLVQILKAKCYELQINCRGTAAKLMDCQTVISYERLMKEALCTTVEVADWAISLFRLMERRQSLPFLFNAQVQRLIGCVTKLQNTLLNLMKINEWSAQGRQLLHLIFARLLSNCEFRQQLKALGRRVIGGADKALKQYLFDQHTVMVFLNMLDQVGKIVKTSKNLPAVLGYSPHDLQGIQIDNLLVGEMRGLHTNHMVFFVQSYDRKKAINPVKVLFYAFNHRFQLQRLQVGYSLVMSSFNMFQLCGILRKAPSEGEVVLSDQFCNVQGWTRRIGHDLGFYELGGAGCDQYNLLPLMPALIKYAKKKQDISIRTIFFRVRNMRVDAMKLREQLGACSQQDWYSAALQAFFHLLEEDVIDGYLVHVDLKHVSFFRKEVNLRQIVFKSYHRILNFIPLRQKIQRRLAAQFDDIPLQQKTLPSDEGFLLQGLESTDGTASNLQTQFTLQFGTESIVRMSQLQLQQQKQEYNCSHSIQPIPLFNNEEIINGGDSQKPKAKQQQKQSRWLEQEQEDGYGEVHASLEHSWIAAWLLAAVGSLLLALVIYDFAYLNYQKKTMNQFCDGVLKRNRALAITVKSLFAPNISYIRQFSNNALLDRSTYLSTSQFQFKTSFGQSLILNQYYLFNVHLPSLLERVLHRDEYISASASLQLQINYGSILASADLNFKASLHEWSTKTEYIRSLFVMKLVLLILGVIALIGLASCLFVSQSQRIQKYEAFFRFQKTDMDKKIQQVRRIARVIEARAGRWLLFKDFNAFVKQADISNLQFDSITTPYQPRIKFEVSQQRQIQIKAGRKCKLILAIAFFTLSQILFLSLYGYLTSKFISDLTQIPNDLDDCSKLIILPHLLLASISNPTDLLFSYNSATRPCLTKIISNLPGLSNYLSSPPCTECPYLYPLLTNNYVSFFSSFQEMTVLVRQNNKVLNLTKKQEMILAADVVADLLYEKLIWLDLNQNSVILGVYFFSIVLLFLLQWKGLKEMSQQIKKIQGFLKFFKKQILQKNKLMGNLLTREN